MRLLEDTDWKGGQWTNQSYAIATFKGLMVSGEDSLGGGGSVLTRSCLVAEVSHMFTHLVLRTALQGTIRIVPIL